MLFRVFRAVAVGALACIKRREPFTERKPLEGNKVEMTNARSNHT